MTNHFQPSGESQTIINPSPIRFSGKVLRTTRTLCRTWGAVGLIGLVMVARGQDYPEAHPPVGQQPHRPAGYAPFHYPKSAKDLLEQETPALLEHSYAAWNQMRDVIGKGPYRAEHESIATHPCPEWFLDAKFGMFIDWGPWSVAGWAPQMEKATYPDWYERNSQADKSEAMGDFRSYHVKTWGADIKPDDLIQLMRADGFHAEQFTDLAKAAGMRYVVPFLKHHGGYCLWNSSFTHRNSMEWGLKRDFAGELSQACRTAGLRYGAYVSLGEWGYPIIREKQLWTQTLGHGWEHGRLALKEKLTADTPFISGKIPVHDYSREYLVPSIKELIDQTSPDLLWFDGQWEADPSQWYSPELAAYYYNRAAARGQKVCINDRMGIDTQRYPGWGDFYVSEYHVIKGFQSHPWEENRSLSHSYGYNWEESFDDRFVMSENDALDLLLRTVANGGNLLLMISPDGSGHIPPNQERRLRFLGQWLARNGEAIYATRPVRLEQQPDWGYLTRSKNGRQLYCIIRNWPANGELTVPISAKQVKTARIIGSPAKPAVSGQAGGLRVNLSGIQAPDPNASVVVLELKEKLNLP